MNRKVVEFMSTPVITVDMEDTIEKVEKVFNEKDLQSVPVIDKSNGPLRSECFGIISLTDLAHFRDKKRNPKFASAWEICTFRPETVSPDSTLREAAQMMVDKKIHHLVVMQNDRVAGFVSALDLIKEFLLSKDSWR